MIQWWKYWFYNIIEVWYSNSCVINNTWYIFYEIQQRNDRFYARYEKRWLPKIHIRNISFDSFCFICILERLHLMFMKYLTFKPNLLRVFVLLLLTSIRIRIKVRIICWWHNEHFKMKLKQNKRIKVHLPFFCKG